MSMSTLGKSTFYCLLVLSTTSLLNGRNEFLMEEVVCSLNQKANLLCFSKGVKCNMSFYGSFTIEKAMMVALKVWCILDSPFLYHNWWHVEIPEER